MSWNEANNPSSGMTGTDMISSIDGSVIGSWGGPSTRRMEKSLASQGALESPLQYYGSQGSYLFDDLKRKAGQTIYNMLTGTQAKKRKQETCFESSVTKYGKGRGRMKHRSATGNTPSSLLKDCRDYVGGAGIQAQQQIALPLSMKIGKREYVNPIPTFLANLTGKGTVRTEWNGLIETDIDQRKYFMTLFRHRLDATATDSIPNASIAYPLPGSTNIGNNILYPYNTIANAIQVDSNAAAALTAKLTSSFYTHAQGQVYWAPLNRPDYEDMSWNLNKLRLGQDDETNNQSADLGATVNELFQESQAVMHSTSGTATGTAGSHRGLSQIELNNNRNSGIVTIGGNTNYLGASYKYNMVFNHGTAHYYFLNKESSGCKVEVIVYRFKKNHKAPSLISALTPTTALVPLVHAVGEGYLDTKIKRLGTDDLGGRSPNSDDVTKNPNYPLLPHLSATKQANQPWKELMRNTFVLPAGGRRSVDVQFPGEVYDPSNTPLVVATTTSPTVPTGGSYPAQFYGQWDQHTYGVVIAVNGVPTTRNVRADAGVFTQPLTPLVKIAVKPSDHLYGDCHDKANLQYYCVYTEHLSGCVYQAPQKGSIFVKAETMNPPTISGTATTLIQTANDAAATVTKAVNMEGVTILPVTSTVRNARTQVTSIGTTTTTGNLSATSTGTTTAINVQKQDGVG